MAGLLDDRLQAVLDDFDLLDGWNARYEYLIALGSDLPPLSADLRTEITAVSGCLSPVWLTGRVVAGAGEPVLELQGDSEGLLPKGLVALCVQLFSGASPAEILAWKRPIATDIGLDANLSPTRAAAFQNLLVRVRDLAEKLPATAFHRGQVAGGYHDRFGGLERIYGDGSLERLRRANVAVVGLGGVGTWAAEALARSGVGHLVLIDRDDVCVTNTNRQIHALDGQFGRFKVEAMADRLRHINPDMEIRTELHFLTAANAERLLTPTPDYVIDAMDSVPDKAALAVYCLNRKIPLLVCGGAGGKSDPTKIRTADLAKTFGDPLLKSFKRRLKTEFGREVEPGQSYGLTCVFSEEPAVMPWQVCSTVTAPSGGHKIGCETGFGSVSFVTGAFGFALAGQVVVALGRGRSDRPVS